jgi:hypothetical protein
MITSDGYGLRELGYEFTPIFLREAAKNLLNAATPFM